MKKKSIAILPGDGVGPEVIKQAIKVLDAISDFADIEFDYQYGDIGGKALDRHNTPLPKETLQLCTSCDAVLLGAIGDPKWDSGPADKRPERGLLGLRKELGLFANLRPARVFSALENASTLKKEIISGVDILIVRELTGGLYFGTPAEDQGDKAYNTMVYTQKEVDRIADIAFAAAAMRRQKLTSVDKANVLLVSQLWRRRVKQISQTHPNITMNHMYVDNCAMQLVRNPGQFDVILTGNLFGDILSDEASMLTGSLGMLPSASLGESRALYEPVHGSAPDIAGQNKANPIAMIASVAMMFRYSFKMKNCATRIENAINRVLTEGLRTVDIADSNTTAVSTEQMGTAIAEKCL
ncbi:3-isopropylmalate dehydrogenase [candidate division KSB1 bacterium]|nr:3-isopropylmalate dehydrogenase [candidate division KSB1 bacterium]